MIRALSLAALLFAACLPAPEPSDDLGAPCEYDADCTSPLACFRRMCTVRCEPLTLPAASPLAETMCEALGGECGEFDLCYP